MVSNFALLASAIGIVQLSKNMPSPLREVLLFSVCMGVLVGSSLMQQAGKDREEGPPVPKGWTWLRGFGRGGAAAGSSKPEEAEDQPEVMMFAGGGSASDEESLGFAMVPGNPGIPHFYADFGEKIHAALLASGAGPAKIYVVGYPSFTTSAAGAKAREALGGAHVDDEAEEIGAVLTKLRKRHRRGVVLLGHSIGAFSVTQHLLKESQTPSKPPLPPVPVAVLAMPYLEYSGRIQSIAWVAVRLPFYTQVIRCVALTLSLLPRKLLDTVARFVELIDQQREQIVSMLKGQPHHLTSGLVLAKSELSRLNPAVTPGSGIEELKPLFEAKKRPHILGLYTSGDHWAPMVHAAKLKAAVKETDEVLDVAAEEHGTVVDGKAPPHGFVTSEKHLGPIAKLIAARVATQLPHKK